MEKEKTNLRLSKFIHSTESYNNLLTIYKALKGKENLEKRLFLKGIVYASINPKHNNSFNRKWMSPTEFFSPSRLGYFTLEYFNILFSAYIKKNSLDIFGYDGKDIYGHLI